MVKIKSQKVWSRPVDFCDYGEGKTWRGWIPPPPAEIGLIIGYEVQQLLPVHQLQYHYFGLLWSELDRVLRGVDHHLEPEKI